MASDILTINVGGVLYTTAVSTLRRAPFFEALLNHTSEDAVIRCSSTYDSDGRLFIDRSGSLFSELLQYLRTGEISSSITNPSIRAALDSEFRFFGLDFPSVSQALPSVAQECVIVAVSDHQEQYRIRVTGPRHVLDNNVRPILDPKSQTTLGRLNISSCVEQISQTTSRMTTTYDRDRVTLREYKELVDVMCEVLVHDLCSIGFSLSQLPEVAKPPLEGNVKRSMFLREAALTTI